MKLTWAFDFSRTVRITCHIRCVNDTIIFLASSRKKCFAHTSHIGYTIFLLQYHVIIKTEFHF